MRNIVKDFNKTIYFRVRKEMLYNRIYYSNIVPRINSEVSKTHDRIVNEVMITSCNGLYKLFK